MRLALEANEVLQAALHLQNLLLAPRLVQQGKPSSAAAHNGDSVEAYATMRKHNKQGGPTALRPASMILPNKSQAAVISPKVFSPKKEEMRAHLPVKVDRSISQPPAATPRVPSSPSFYHPATGARNLTTDYPPIRSASSMTSLPTDAGARTDPKATRAMLEAWKKNKIETTGGRTVPAQGSSAVPLHHSPRPGGPRAVVEIPGGHLPPKHQGRQYMSSPNILQDSTNPSTVKIMQCLIPS